MDKENFDKNKKIVFYIRDNNKDKKTKNIGMTITYDY